MLSGFTLVLVLVVVVFVTFLALVSRYKRCPSDKILVVYGRTGKGTANTIHGGGAFIWPVIQDFAYLDLKPMSIEANLTNALSLQNIRVDVPCRFTIAVSTEPSVMGNAAERLLGLTREQIQELSKDILFGQLRLVIAMMTIEEINSDRDTLLDNISKNVDTELRKVGLKLINVNITDISDESGYIEALGKEAAAKAINEAKVSVAEQEKLGETGKADADREKDITIAEYIRDRDVKIANTNKNKEVGVAIAFKDEQIGKAEADRDSRIFVSMANSKAVEGENLAKVAIANSDAERREKEAVALKIAVAAEKVQAAKALEESYHAEQKAEAARASRERSTREADVLVPADIEKAKAIIEAQAEAEKVREEAKGEADAIFAVKAAEAKGMYEILMKQAEGFDRVVRAAGGDTTAAFQLLLLEKLPELVTIQVEAIKGIKIDKVTVWDSGASGNGDGKTNTANFVSGLMKAVPPLNELFKMAGMELPKFLKGENPTIEVVENSNDGFSENGDETDEIEDNSKEKEE